MPTPRPASSRLKTSTAAPRLSRRFFACPPETLARALLGCRLVRILDGGTRLAGVIVETEAYLGVRDRAAHSFDGRRTPRNESMYGPPGTLYVYFTYGMHFCCNVVCGKPEEPVAVLIRGLEPADGLDAMRAHRRPAASNGSPRPLPDRHLCSGPARLCQALRIDRDLDGLDLTGDPRLWLERGRRIPDVRVSRGPRIGVGYADDWASRPLRWFVEGSEHVSPGRAAGRSGG